MVAAAVPPLHSFKTMSARAVLFGFQENEPRRSFHERRGTCHYSHYNYQQAPDACSSSRCTWYSFRSNKALVTDVVVIFWHLVSCHHCCHHYLDRSESLGFVLMFLAALSFIFTLSNTIPDCSWTLCMCVYVCRDIWRSIDMCILRYIFMYAQSNII